MLEKNQFDVPPFEKKENSMEKLEVEVRIATPEEWEKFRDFRIKFLEDEGGRREVATPRQIREIKRRTGEKWKDILFGNDNFFLLAFQNSEVVGMGRVEKKKGTWYLYNLGVKKELRRERVGAKITAISLNGIKSRGGKEVRAIISKKNIASIKNAESFGFKDSKNLLDRLRNIMIIDDISNPVTTKRIEEVLNEK